MIPRVAVAINAAAFALLSWLYAGDLFDAARARSSEVAALSGLPNVPFAVGVLALAAVGIVLTFVGLAGARDRAWRGYRVMPIVAVVGLFVDLFVLPSNKSPFSSSARAQAALEVFQSKASELSGARVSADARALQGLVDELGDAPWLLNGAPAGRWRLQVTTGCQGPRTERGGAPAGTLMYCVAADRSRAWVTAVGLPREVRFGPAQLVSAGGQPLVALVQRREHEGDDEASVPPPRAPEDPGQLPLRFEADAGNLPVLP